MLYVQDAVKVHYDSKRRRVWMHGGIVRSVSGFSYIHGDTGSLLVQSSMMQTAYNLLVWICGGLVS